jgi:hypothetical protein
VRSGGLDLIRDGFDAGLTAKAKANGHAVRDAPPTPGANGKAFEPPPEIAPFETFDAGDWEGLPIEAQRGNREPAAQPSTAITCRHAPSSKAGQESGLRGLRRT